MEQKINRREYVWIRVLLIGISILFISGCKIDVEPKVLADFIYKNSTNYTVSYSYIALDNSDTINLFTLNPMAEKVFNINGKGDRNPDIATCCEGFLDGLQGHGFPILITFDDSKCITYTEGEGPTTSNISSYEAEVLDDNHFQYTYRFTEDDFLKTEPCK